MKRAIIISALIGTNLTGLVLHTNRVQSSDCPQPTPISGNNGTPPNVNENIPYDEHNPWANAPAVPTSSSKTPAKGLSISDAEIDGAIARERQEQARSPGIAPAEAAETSEPAPLSTGYSSLLGNETEESYQARRRAIAVQMEGGY